MIVHGLRGATHRGLGGGVMGRSLEPSICGRCKPTLDVVVVLMSAQR